MPAPKKSVKSTKSTKEVLKRSQTLKKKKRVGKFIIFFILAIFLIVGLGYLLYLPSLSVQAVTVQGNNILDSENIIDQVNQNLEGEYWYLFPRRSVFIYPKKIILDDLQEKFPRLSETEIGLGEWDSLIVNVVERSSDVIWCKDNESPRDVLGQIIIEDKDPDTAELASEETKVSNESEQNCFFADDGGFVFAPAPYFSNSVFVELSGFLSERPIGTTPLAEKSYSIITHFAKNLAKIFSKTTNDKYRVIKVRIIDKSNYEVVVVDTSRTATPEWKIFFNNTYSAEELTSNLYTVLNSEPFKKEMLTNKGDLASIDLRYGKKVFYRFK